MRIGFLLETDGPGGAETMVLDLASELRDRGHEVVPILPRRHVGWLHDSFTERQFHSIEFPTRSRPALLAPFRLAKVLRPLHLDLVHAHEFTMALFGTAAARLVGLPSIISMHGGQYFAEARRRRIMMRWAVKSSSACVCVATEVAQSMEQVLGLREGLLRVIPNGRSFTEGNRTRGRREMGVREDSRVILAVGSLYQVKGYDVLLRAFSLLVRGRGGEDLVLVIAGRGGELERLRSLASGLDIASRVRFLGLRSDIPDLLAGADVFALSSHSEGLPLALLEAMAAAKPIVATAVGGIPNVARHEREALLVAPGSPEEMADALRKILESQTVSMRMGREARARAYSEFSASGMAESYIDLYESFIT